MALRAGLGKHLSIPSKPTATQLSQVFGVRGTVIDTVSLNVRLLIRRFARRLVALLDRLH